MKTTVLRTVTVLFLLSKILPGQLADTSGGRQGGGTGTVGTPHTVTGTGTTVTIAASAHGKGTNPIWVQGSCRNSSTGDAIAFTSFNVAANGDVTGTWSASVPYICSVAVSGQQGTPGAPGAPGTTTYAGLTDAPTNDPELATLLTGKVNITVSALPPSGNCTAGRDLHYDTNFERMWRCRADNLWTPDVKTLRGTGAPVSNACDQLDEVLTFRIREDPANLDESVSVCRQTGASTFAWGPLGAGSSITLPVTSSLLKGNNAGGAVAAAVGDVTILFTGTGDCLGSDGTRKACSGGSGTEATDAEAIAAALGTVFMSPRRVETYTLNNILPGDGLSRSNLSPGVRFAVDNTVTRTNHGTATPGPCTHPSQTYTETDANIFYGCNGTTYFATGGQTVTSTVSRRATFQALPARTGSTANTTQYTLTVPSGTPAPGDQYRCFTTWTHDAGADATFTNVPSLDFTVNTTQMWGNTTINAADVIWFWETVVQIVSTTRQVYFHRITRTTGGATVALVTPSYVTTVNTATTALTMEWQAWFTTAPTDDTFTPEGGACLEIKAP